MFYTTNDYDIKFINGHMKKYAYNIPKTGACRKIDAITKTNASFTHNGFDDQKRNLAFVKTEFQVSELKFHACNFKQAFYPLHNYIYRVTLTTQKYLHMQV